MKTRLFLCWLLAGTPWMSDAATYVSVNLNLSTYPDLVPVPGYPVYYAPHLRSNFFFYDGLYWLLIGDSWYVSSWYNGPWSYVGPDAVPLFLLRIPVRYYLDPPIYFGDWRRDAPPLWGRHWGPDWERRHDGWDRWNRRAAPPPAPLPVYQRQYSGARYPQPAQQQALHSQNYRYRPHDAVVQRLVPVQAARPGPAAPEPAHMPPGRQEHPPQAQSAQRHVAPAHPAPAPPAPNYRMESNGPQREAGPGNRPPAPREEAPVRRPPQREERALERPHAAPPPGRAEPPHEAARPEHGQEQRKGAPPAKQNEGRRDKEERDNRQP
ncbi:MAG TPA: hypothetical protein VFT05_18810 [Burkholderiaceae bacterium]|nr:hypothetical protein [Burkholderiaceae bacterium]